jgi:hypothetical protein
MEFNNLLHSVSIIHSRRARHLRISIDHEKNVSLIIPRRSSEEQGIRFLNSRREWVEKTLSKIKPRKKQPWDFKFEEETQIFFFGLPHRLQFTTDRMYPYVTKTQSAKLRSQNLNENNDGAVEIITPSKKKVFENFLSNKLREHIYTFAFKFCKTYGFAFRDLKIKSMRSRWGSCSRLGNLNFSLRLVHFDREVINYVVVHELCHMREMNHSRRFWELVGQFCPNYKIYIKQLK